MVDVDRHDRPSSSGRRREPSSKNTGSAVGEYELVTQLSELARTLQQYDDVEETLDAIVHASVDTVPGAQCAAISSVEGRRHVLTRAPSDELARAVDHAQHETGQGPCLDTLFERQTERVSDLASERRWPKFTSRAVELGVRSMLSIQLYVVGDDLGALNLISREPDAFSDESEHVGLLFASHAAVAMAGAEHQEHLHRALDNRDVIGQAKGILMERFKITGDEAFRLLMLASQRSNRKLHEVAQTLAHSGEMPRGS